MTRRLTALLAAILLVITPLTLCRAQAGGASYPSVEYPLERLTNRTLGVLINDADPVSVATGNYYVAHRAIPTANVLHVSIPANTATLDVASFASIERAIHRRLPTQVQALALVWTQPYRVGCMSITTAFALGYDPDFCAQGCQKTKRSVYYSPELIPTAHAPVLPTMLVAGANVESVESLIDRGIRSDDSWPSGTAYLIETADTARNVRAALYPSIQQILGKIYPVKIAEANGPGSRDDVMFYFTGIEAVQEITRLKFRDGAIADHLTSFGGVLVGSSQMSSIEWLEAGATGSYGTVSEPCNFPSKFPAPGLVMARYLTGSTLVEAYWASVEMPGQGVFIGEPLARPFGGWRMAWDGVDLVLSTRTLTPGNYLIQEAASPADRFRTLGLERVTGIGLTQIRIPRADSRHVYRVAQTLHL